MSSGATATELLLVEDDPEAATLFVRRVSHLAPGEFNVTQARSLQAGLDEATEVDFGLAVLDLTLPDSAGIETCARFSSAQPNVPFIVLTGVQDGALSETLSRAGASGSFIKDDCSSSDLVSAIRAVRTPMQRRRPEVTRAVAEARFRNAVIDSADGIVVLDRSGKVQLVSAGAESLLGRPAADLTGAPLGIDLSPGTPVRAQMIHEDSGHATAHNAVGPVQEFDVCRLRITEVEFWPFSHVWANKPVTVCALRDVSNQSAEESRQRNIVRIEEPLQVSSGIYAVGTDLALRLGTLLRFNRFEAALWRPDLQRLQMMFELGSEARGRGVSSLVEQSSVPGGFGSWLTEWSGWNMEPRIAVSVGYADQGEYGARDAAAVARCANMLSAALSGMKNAPVFSTVDQLTDLDDARSSLYGAA